MRKPDRTRLLEARLLVGYLGERAQCNWWETAFHEPSSRPFLGPVFIKTAGLARYHGVCEAARRLHDEHLNVDGFHLFRLPEEIEQDLHGLMQGDVGETISACLTQSREAALDALSRLAIAGRPASDGPTRVGTIAELASERTLGLIAEVYRSAFSQGIRAYPYLTP
ncbi:hypothetical protein CKO25_11210 [Thiocapsa imhoffii]|uniref:BrxE family protein n=1 Tax=Thiocapsa imhoffii TaxID=382777 RepID=A0A9X1B9N7_9GAMM|nr:BrxE family protein [Thiocapsa imhoffii]MBK1645201.1 hypothetical protein [Thiocapsa imhoffii]